MIDNSLLDLLRRCGFGVKEASLLTLLLNAPSAKLAASLAKASMLKRPTVYAVLGV
jgi:sugar-specific transcriptional regulator TrmB